MNFTVRSACLADAEALCEVINPLIEKGETTAHLIPFTSSKMVSAYIEAPLGVSCLLAEKDRRILGFQALERADPNWTGPDPVPSGWGLIASFVRPDAAGQGVGRALFAETLHAARDAGIKTIDATIRADNQSGLKYYSAIGFQDYAVLRDIALSDGRKVDRIRKRYDLSPR